MPISEFYPRVFISSSDEADDVRLLQKMNIRAVLTCGIMFTPWCSVGCNNIDFFANEDFDKYSLHEDELTIPGVGMYKVKHLALELFDCLDANFKPFVDGAVKFIERNLADTPDGNVLVHCHAGQSRSASFCIAYLMHKLDLGPGPCLERIRAVYPNASPNSTFLRQLHELDSEGWAASTRRPSFSLACLKGPDDEKPKNDIMMRIDSSQSTEYVQGNSSSLVSLMAEDEDTASSSPDLFFSPLGSFNFQAARVRLEARRAKTAEEQSEDGPGAAGGEETAPSTCADPNKDNGQAALPIVGSPPTEGQPPLEPSKGVSFVSETTTASPLSPSNAIAAATENKFNKSRFLPAFDEQSGASVAYSCWICKSKVFYDTDIVPHEVSQRHKNQKFARGFQPEPQCSSFFVEHLHWMNLPEGEQTGKILCPNERCGYKLGGFSFHGARCSCGAWQTPSFQIHSQRVDSTSLEGWLPIVITDPTATFEHSVSLH